MQVKHIHLVFFLLLKRLSSNQSEVLSHMLNHAHACLKAFCFSSNEYRQRNTCSISRAEGQSLIQPLHHGNIKRCSCKQNCSVLILSTHVDVNSQHWFPIVAISSSTADLRSEMKSDLHNQAHTVSKTQ